MPDESNNQQDKKKQKPTFPNMVFPSAGEVESEYFGGTAPEKVSLDEVKQAKEEQKNEKPKDENKEQNPEQKQNEKSTEKNQENKEDKNSKEQNPEQKKNVDNSQQQNPYKENSIKALKDLGFNSQDNKKFLRKIKDYEVLIEIP